MLLWFLIQFFLTIIELVFGLLYIYMIVKIKRAEQRSGITIPKIWNIIFIGNFLMIIISIVAVFVIKLT